MFNINATRGFCKTPETEFLLATKNISILVGDETAKGDFNAYHQRGFG